MLAANGEIKDFKTLIEKKAAEVVLGGREELIESLHFVGGNATEAGEPETASEAANTPEHPESIEETIKPEQERFIEDFVSVTFFQEGNIRQIVAEVAQEAGMRIDETNIARLINAIQNPENEIRQKLLSVPDKDVIKKAVADPLNPDPKKMRELGLRLGKELKKIIKSDFGDYFRKEEVKFSPEQQEWIYILSQEGQEYYNELFEMLEKSGEKENHTNEEIMAKLVTPFIEGIYNQRMLGKRGFTENLKGSAINETLGKITLI